jgi:hypothetical protein
MKNPHAYPVSGIDRNSDDDENYPYPLIVEICPPGE